MYQKKKTSQASYDHRPQKEYGSFLHRIRHNFSFTADLFKKNCAQTTTPPSFRGTGKKNDCQLKKTSSFDRAFLAARMLKAVLINSYILGKRTPMHAAFAAKRPAIRPGVCCRLFLRGITTPPPHLLYRRLHSLRILISAQTRNTYTPRFLFDSPRTDKSTGRYNLTRHETRSF